LEKGRSTVWTEQLADFVGDDGKMNATALLNYFQPLDDFLIAQIDEHDIPVSVLLILYINKFENNKPLKSSSFHRLKSTRIWTTTSEQTYQLQFPL